MLSPNSTCAKSLIESNKGSFFFLMLLFHSFISDYVGDDSVIFVTLLVVSRSKVLQLELLH